MFEFFTSIFTRVTSAIASVIIAVGLVSIPTPPVEIVLEKPQQPVTQEDIAETAAPTPSPTNADVQAKIDNLKILLESKRKKVEELVKQKENEIVEFPSGAVVELDADGKIFRTIKEAPQEVFTSPPETNSSAIFINIGSTEITTDTVRLEWFTNLPTESKLFFTQPNGSIEVFPSISGNSTKHIVDISSLISDTLYTYTIEAIAGIQSKKIDGLFTTRPQSFVAESVKSPTNTNDIAPFLRFFSDRQFRIKKLVLVNDDTYCRQLKYPYILLTLSSLSSGSNSMDAKKDPAGHFIFNFSKDGLIASDVFFRLVGGTQEALSSSCVREGMKFTLLNSGSVIYNESGQQINFQDLVLFAEPKPEIIQTRLSGNSSNYTFINRTSRYFGYTSVKVKVWQGEIVDPHENVRVEVYLDGQLVSPIRQNTDTNNFMGDFTVLSSSIIGDSEEFAITVTVPLPNERNIYCKSCGHLVIPTARRNLFPTDAAAYIRFETHADGVNNQNDVYFIKLISFEGETFGTIPSTNNFGNIIYTF